MIDTTKLGLPWKAHPLDDPSNKFADFSEQIRDCNGKLVLYIQREGTPAQVRELRDAILTAMRSHNLLAEALQHQIFRNHRYSETCDACRKSIQILNAVD